MRPLHPGSISPSYSASRAASRGGTPTLTPRGAPPDSLVPELSTVPAPTTPTGTSSGITTTTTAPTVTAASTSVETTTPTPTVTPIKTPDSLGLSTTTKEFVEGDPEGWEFWDSVSLKDKTPEQQVTILNATPQKHSDIGGGSKVWYKDVSRQDEYKESMGWDKNWSAALDDKQRIIPTDKDGNDMSKFIKGSDPLQTFLKGQVTDPAIAQSAQQTYEKIITNPEDFLTETDKKVATDLNMSLTEAAKSKILLTSQGTYSSVEPDNIEGLKSLMSSTYEENVSIISDAKAGDAEATAQFISSLDTVYSDLTNGVVGAEGTITQGAEAATRNESQEQAALAQRQEAIDAAQIRAQTGVAETVEGIPTAVDSVDRAVNTIDKAIEGSATVIPDADIDAIFDETTPTPSYEATVGSIRSGSAATVSGSEKVGDAVREIAQGQAAIDELEDTKVIAAIAEMPQEALVSSQLETLLEAVENDEVPAWAKPAVEQVEALLAKRGMGKSTVGRDALFNAIITAATPLAQSNAQALQTQALQNQANRQSANELQAKMSQDIRMANLSNRQTMELENLRALNSSQSEQFSFEAQQKLKEYETLVSFKNTNTEYAQQMELANLNDELQMELANLSHTNNADAANMSVENQSRLLELQTYVDFTNKNADFKQQMELTNLDMKSKVEFANLSALNLAAQDQMTVDQQKALTEYQSKVEVGKYNAELAQQMGIANLSNKQQSAVQNAMNSLNMDLKKLDLDQQVELANSTFAQTMTATDLSNRQAVALLNATNMATMDMANLSNAQQAQVTNAQNFLKLDLTNLSNAQQAELFNDQWQQQVLMSNQSVENAAKQFASSAENDINKFIASMETNVELNNAARNDAMTQLNVTEENKTDALNQANDAQVELFNASLRESIAKFEETVNFQRETFNASMTQQIDSSNVQWRRNMNTANTAGVNAVNQANAINAFNLSSDAMNKIWQELRDTASWEFQVGQTETAAKAQMALAVLGNESAEYLTKLKINADDETSMGEGLANLFGGILEGDYKASNITGFFD